MGDARGKKDDDDCVQESTFSFFFFFLSSLSLEIWTPKGKEGRSLAPKAKKPGMLLSLRLERD